MQPLQKIGQVSETRANWLRKYLVSESGGAPSHRSQRNITRSMLSLCYIHGMRGSRKTSCNGLANKKLLHSDTVCVKIRKMLCSIQNCICLTNFTIIKQNLNKSPNLVTLISVFSTQRKLKLGFLSGGCFLSTKMFSMKRFESSFCFFIKMGHPRPLFHLFSVFFIQTIKI